MTAPRSSLSFHLQFPRVLLNRFVNLAQFETNPWDTLSGKQGSYQRLLWSSRRSNSKGKGLPIAKGQYEDQRDWMDTNTKNPWQLNALPPHWPPLWRAPGLGHDEPPKQTNGWAGQAAPHSGTTASEWTVNERQCWKPKHRDIWGNREGHDDRHLPSHVRSCQGTPNSWLRRVMAEATVRSYH